ncbi:MAG: phosphomevalonate kinase [Candidatus Sericytochromatia bacterium]|nr:phosphomevalonate kinase [Candidatus Sericytochromatia bacterium]
MSWQLRVPGKLMLAGEYAILTPGSLALMLGVQRYLYIDCSPADSFQLHSELHAEAWPLPTDGSWQQAPEALRFAAAAAQTALAYLSALPESPALAPLTLSLRSELAHKGLKLGLGSSAAVCVGVVSALLTGAGLPLAESAETRFKLAYLAHSAVQGNGSGADIAACVYGSVLAYTRPDPDRLPGGNLLSCVQQPWPLLGLEKIAWPAELQLSFGWTGQPAHSGNWIKWFEAWQRESERPAHDFSDPFASPLSRFSAPQFLFDANANALALRQALLDQSSESLVAGIARSRRQLQWLNAALPEPPETEALAQLADIAEALGGAGKLSGAGGGDCGLAWVTPAEAQTLAQRWHEAGIVPLDLALDLQGAVLI